MKPYLLFLSVGLLLSTGFCADTTTLVYNNFNVVTDWQLNNDCSVVTNSRNQKVLRLTPSNALQAGSAFVKSPIPLTSSNGFKASFSAAFSFEITSNNGLSESDGTGADGIVFVIQTIDNKVGSTGGGIGYKNVGKSLGIEFDTWANSEEEIQDKDGNHVGIDTSGSVISKKTIKEKKRFNDGNIWYAWIDYDGDKKLLQVRYDTVNIRPVTPKLTDTINLPPILGTQNAFVGFTSATGQSYSNHDILTFSFINKFQPFTYNLSLTASPDTVVSVNELVTLKSIIHDMNNVNLPDSAMKTAWKIIDAGSNPQSILKSAIGASVQLVPVIPESVIKIEGSAVINGKLLADTITIRVKKMEIFTLELSAIPDSIVNVEDTVILRATIFNSKNEPVPDSAKNTTWKIISAGTNPQSILKSSNGASVHLIPSAPNSDIIIEATVTVNGTQLRDTIHVHVRALDPFLLTISAQPDTVIRSHDTVTLHAKVFNGKNETFSDSAEKTIWRIISASDNPLSILKTTKGKSVLMVPEIPYSTITVEASVTVNEILLKDTLQIRVIPGKPSRLSIESRLPGSDITRLRNASPIDTVYLTKYPDSATIFSVIRDQWGGFCRVSDSNLTVWSTLAGTGNISITNENQKKFECTISRAGSDEDGFVSAQEPGLIADSTYISISGLFYNALQIRDKVSGKKLDSLQLTISQERTLAVFGLLEGKDPAVIESWIPISGAWSVSENIKDVQIPPPSNSTDWSLVPQKAGSGTVSVKSINGTINPEVSIPVQITGNTPPFLIKATFVQPTNATEPGIITLTFSVDVNVEMLKNALVDEALIYFNSEGHLSSEILKDAHFKVIANDQFSNTISVIMGRGAGLIIPVLDSIALIAHTVTRFGISPDKENPVKVPVVNYTKNITINALFNPIEIERPFSAETNVMYSNIIKNNQSGALIVVYSNIPLKKINDQYGKVIVYDALGNIVTSDCKLEIVNTSNRNHYAIYWNCKNKRERTVGRGTYLVKVLTTDTNNNPYKLQLKIGIKE